MPSLVKKVANKAKNKHQLSVGFVCNCFNISRSSYYYQPKLSGDNTIIANYLTRLTQTHKRWGFKLCYFYLRNVQGYKFNHKRVYRIYRELELNLRIKPKSRIKRDKLEALSVPKHINQMWSMDFMSDSLIDGRLITTFYDCDTVEILLKSCAENGVLQVCFITFEHNLIILAFFFI